jgi:hypothetical protein
MLIIGLLYRNVQYDQFYHYSVLLSDYSLNGLNPARLMRNLVKA